MNPEIPLVVSSSEISIPSGLDFKTVVQTFRTTSYVIRTVVVVITRPIVWITSLMSNVVYGIISVFLGPPYRVLRITTRVLYPIYVYVIAAILAGICIGLLSGTLSEMLATFLADRSQLQGSLLVKEALLDDPKWVDEDDDDVDDEDNDSQVAASSNLKS